MEMTVVVTFLFAVNVIDVIIVCVKLEVKQSKILYLRVPLPPGLMEQALGLSHLPQSLQFAVLLSVERSDSVSMYLYLHYLPNPSLMIQALLPPNSHLLKSRAGLLKQRIVEPHLFLPPLNALVRR